MQDNNSEIGDNEEEPTTGFQKFRSIALSIMLLMISMGQWNDTKDVAIAAYEEVISRFTNNIQYEKLAKLRIGYTVDYTQTLIGNPRVIKPIRSIEGGYFSYYSSPKYLVVTASKDDRVIGFSVTANDEYFDAPIAYVNKNLQEKVLSSYFEDADSYATDFGNSNYFLEMLELNHQQMFYEFSIGIIGSHLISEDALLKIRGLNQKLNQGEEPLLADLELPSLLKPNYYSVSEISSEVMHESILSKYEMKFLFNQ